ncbi:MAG: hypothetical protein AB7K24_07915 [Gemmataceae bacterium]
MNRNAESFCAEMRLKLRPEGRALLRPGLDTVAYFAELLRADNLADARRVLAHALPRRRALWWGCLCAWEAYRPEPPHEVATVLHAVSEYVITAADEQRRRLRVLGMAAGLNTLGGHLALAGFCSAGSLSKPGLPVVTAPVFATGRLVSVAVYLASVKRDPARYRDRLRQFLSVGLEVARGESLWPAVEEERVASESSTPPARVVELVGSMS